MKQYKISAAYLQHFKLGDVITETSLEHGESIDAMLELHQAVELVAPLRVDIPPVDITPEEVPA